VDPHPAHRTTKTMRPTQNKNTCASPLLHDTLTGGRDEEGFFISPLQEDPTDEEVRRLWRQGLDREP
jgi:hypothetical protein